MRMTDEGIALIKEFEGLMLDAYLCPAGVWTIGYGHTAAAGHPVPVRGMSITEDEADAILRRDLRAYEDGVRKALKRSATPEQFSAMVSLCYNIGPGNFAKSTLVRRFNAGDLEGAAEALTWWNKAGGKVLRGLVRRREAERALFMSSEVGEDGPISPSAPVEGGAQKPLAKSKTAGASTVGVVAATGLGLWAQLKEAGVPQMVGDYAPWVLAGIFAYLFFNRWLEARKGEH